MIDVIKAILACIGLIAALLVTPYLLVRQVCTRANMTATIAFTGAAAVMINVVVPLLLHAMRVPITTGTLSLTHWSLAAILVAISLVRRVGAVEESPKDYAGIILMAAVLVVMVLPFTHLAGMDTYKWQDLATNVRVQQNISWLIHPMSLFGFTDRSYPSAQPLLLATIQIMGGLNVDWGYFLVSVFSCVTGLFAAYELGRRFFGHNSRGAAWVAFLYAFSPVFIRYNYWATGRGLFLSLFPLFVLAVIDLPRLRATIAALVLAVLLALTHKTGFIAVVIVSTSMALAVLLPRRHRWPNMVMMCLPFLAVSCLVAPTVFLQAPMGNLLGFIRYDIARFGWMLPAAALGLLVNEDWAKNRAWCRVFPALLLVLPVAHAGDMYGALVALIFVVLAASTGVIWLEQICAARLRIMISSLVILTMTGALVTVARRARTAMPARLHAAAIFLDAYDPAGPIRVTGPIRATAQVQAYLGGCPRFETSAQQDAKMSVLSPPPIRGKPKEQVNAWINYLRQPLVFSGTDIEWYGVNPRKYRFVIDGNGTRPNKTGLLYQQNGIEIYGPPAPFSERDISKKNINQ